MEAYDVLSVEEAQERILQAFRPLESERVDLFQALDRVLAEDIQADMNIPPLDNTAMDGYAVRAGDTAARQPWTIRCSSRSSTTWPPATSPICAWSRARPSAS